MALDEPHSSESPLPCCSSNHQEHDPPLCLHIHATPQDQHYHQRILTIILWQERRTKTARISEPGLSLCCTFVLLWLSTHFQSLPLLSFLNLNLDSHLFVSINPPFSTHSLVACQCSVFLSHQISFSQAESVRSLPFLSLYLYKIIMML